MGSIHCVNTETLSKHAGWSYKAKIHLELDLAVSMKGCKKAFYRHIGKKGKSSDNTVALLNWDRRSGGKGHGKGQDN